MSDHLQDSVSPELPEASRFTPCYHSANQQAILTSTAYPDEYGRT
jgi:hypothetical protein